MPNPNITIRNFCIAVEGCGHGGCQRPGHCVCWAGWASANGTAPCNVDLLRDAAVAGQLLQGLDPREGAPALLMHRAGSVRPPPSPCATLKAPWHCAMSWFVKWART